jgi:predicted ATPase
MEPARFLVSVDLTTGPGDSGERSGYPFDLAAVQDLDQLEFGAVTVLCGDNGTGKSTLIEAIAVAAGFNPEGGSRNLRFATHDTHSDLADHLTLVWRERPRWGWFLRAESFYGLATHITRDDDPYAGLKHIFPDLHGRSHGESFLALAESRFTDAGLYLLDEPESALSIQGQMRLLVILSEAVAAGAQVILSTHSPFLMAFAGAVIYELDPDGGADRSTFDDLVSTQLWRRFFADPDGFVGRLVEP